MPSATPLAIVKEKFGDKAKLVEAVEAFVSDDLWVSRTNKDKGLAHVSNAKLLRLHALFTEVKQRFGTREKLIDSLLELEKRSKDAGLRQRLLTWPVPRLYDAFKSATKRHRADVAAAEPKAKAAKAPAAPATKASKATNRTKRGAAKAPAKKTAAKKK
jgi:hypothetical protein